MDSAVADLVLAVLQRSVRVKLKDIIVVRLEPTTATKPARQTYSSNECHRTETNEQYKRKPNQRASFAKVNVRVYECQVCQVNS